MRLEQITIKDIARELNVSTSTVSRALKDYPGISDETKRKVKELAEKMDYRPNAIALSLRKSRSFTIGVIIPEVVHFFFSTVISGIEEVAFARGYNVILTQTNEKLVREKSSIATMLSNQIDGVLVSFSKETTDFEHFSNLLAKGFPIVFFDRVPDIDNAITVTVDDYSGAFEATKHLLQQGYRRIAHLSGPSNLKISQERARGYTDALIHHGFTPDPGFIVECNKGTDDEAQKITAEILETFSTKPDAFFANNDMAAVGAMLACKAAGLRVPEDVGIVGFSNWQFCSMIDPSLSSVSQPGFNLGAKATEILLDLIEKKIQLGEYSNSVVLETELLIRKSSVR
ncbi:transcriptional regulator, LacI family [Algoriphagus alkaliphilus]|uniref:Transcriptional regulator, LacI family n=1 Tax=Algoriphagus alkaliphilus TaxID=279824 RepID=A0A1G5XBC5_9BACT|nr:LacI family DNA-binding transcriptional regulator [Algoriphagus alkaliphilus]MBA4300867.1 LacI family transcriptional regulator [Cyclobacterium sp.]SDA67047.1 transcriptional regulator, LacI family [Algoriphagus alkaliphilus]